MQSIKKNKVKAKCKWWKWRKDSFHGGGWSNL